MLIYFCLYLYYLVHLVKNIYLFFIYFLISGCSSGIFDKSNLVKVGCPPILFTSNHKTFIASMSSDISLENIEYKAEINNAQFSDYCYLDEKENIFTSSLSVLFVVKPLIQKEQNINLPFYIAVINKNKDLLDIQYFSTNSNFKKNYDINQLIETEVTKTIFLQHKLVSESISIVIGFMIDEKKLAILN